MREYKEIYTLVGRILKSGWRVVEKIEPKNNRQKGKFSVCYMVEKDGQQRFMKVMDINEHIHRLSPDESQADAFKRVLDQYTYERDVCNYCKGKHLSNVTIVWILEMKVLTMRCLFLCIISFLREQTAM